MKQLEIIRFLDVKNCNLCGEVRAEYELKIVGKKTISIFLCKECLTNMYCIIGKNLIPKPIQNPFKNIVTIRRKYDE